FGQQERQFLLYLLRAEADHAQPIAAARRAARGRGIAPAAIVATQAVVAFVVGEAYVAVVAFGHPSAGLTLPGGHIAAPVLEDDRLFLSSKSLLDAGN